MRSALPSSLQSPSDLCNDHRSSFIRGTASSSYIQYLHTITYNRNKLPDGARSVHASFRTRSSPSAYSLQTRYSFTTSSTATYASKPPIEHEDEDEYTDDTAHNAYQEIVSAFQTLINEAYTLLSKGRHGDAEYILQKGTKEAEEILGKGAFELSPLYDQLALIRFMTDQCDQATTPARQALDIISKFADDDQSIEVRGAASIAAIRYASVLMGSRQPLKAKEVLEGAMHDVHAAWTEALNSKVNVHSSDTINSEDSSKEMDEEYLEKLEIAAGEGRFYQALSHIAALHDPQPDDVTSRTKDMIHGLTTMMQRLGMQHPLIACALREHNRLTEAAVANNRISLAEALYRQEIGLHQQFDPDSEQTVALLYQLGTLQYCNEDAAGAVDSLERAVAMFERGFEGAEEHSDVVRHRLGMALGLKGRKQYSRDILLDVAPKLAEKFGKGNPASLELDIMMAYMALQDELEGKVYKEGKEERVDQLVGEMNETLEALSTYGEDHMLVKAAKRLVEPYNTR